MVGLCPSSCLEERPTTPGWLSERLQMLSNMEMMLGTWRSRFLLVWLYSTRMNISCKARVRRKGEKEGRRRNRMWRNPMLEKESSCWSY